MNNIQDRIMNHAQIDENGCWIWTGSKKKALRDTGKLGSAQEKTEPVEQQEHIGFLTLFLLGKFQKTMIYATSAIIHLA